MARKLTDGTNVQAPDADYPKGKIKDETNPGVSDDGTILNEILHGDIVQFFQKLIIDSGITENDLPDNVTNGYQLIDALVKKIQEETGAVKTKKVNIGNWNMYSTGGGTGSSTFAVAHGLPTFSKILGAVAWIFPDPAAAAQNKLPIDYWSILATKPAGAVNFDATNVNLFAYASQFFDSTDFNDDTFNRGHVVVFYEN